MSKIYPEIITVTAGIEEYLYGTCFENSLYIKYLENVKEFPLIEEHLKTTLGHDQDEINNLFSTLGIDKYVAEHIGPGDTFSPICLNEKDSIKELGQEVIKLCEWAEMVFICLFREYTGGTGFYINCATCHEDHRIDAVCKIFNLTM